MIRTIVGWLKHRADRVIDRSRDRDARLRVALMTEPEQLLITERALTRSRFAEEAAELLQRMRQQLEGNQRLLARVIRRLRIRRGLLAGQTAVVAALFEADKAREENKIAHRLIGNTLTPAIAKLNRLRKRVAEAEQQQSDLEFLIDAQELHLAQAEAAFQRREQCDDELLRMAAAVARVRVLAAAA